MINVRKIDDYRHFDVGTPARCFRCGTDEGVRKEVGDGGFVWACPSCPHPAN